MPNSRFLAKGMLCACLITGVEAEPPKSWPYWPEYHKTPLNEIRPQEWKTSDHVIERLDAWAKAFEKVEQKVFMGGISQYGFKKGFGARRGFVEMYLYHIPDEVIGKTLDKEGYLFVDDSVELLKRSAFHGEENEEYEETWATKERGFRFGENTDSFTYRYFVSNLRTLQMKCNHVLMNPFSIYPEQMVWVGQTLGRTVEDSPDIWCALRESY